MPWSVGDKVVYGGIGCVIAYDAGSEQSWGRYILCEEYDLNHYEPDLGTGGVDETYSGKAWGFFGTSTGVTDTAIGTGKNNTDQLITQNNDNTDTLWYYVNQHRTKTGKSWHIPSKDELNILYENLTQIGNFSTSTSPWYWSSSDYSSSRACTQDFSDGSQSSHSKHNTLNRVRCVAYATEADLDPSPSTVSISCATDGASIYYTMDGNDPTEQSTPYSAPFQATAPVTIKARAYKEGLEPSDIATQSM